MPVKEPISKVNLERLTNGIYAFTMTLMIRNIETPPALCSSTPPPSSGSSTPRC